MRVLVATDAWHPQVNGVIRTLEALAQNARKLGVHIRFLSPEGFRSIQAPTYPGLRLALPSARAIAARIEDAAPDAIHIATEGPVGLMTRAYCRKRGLRFTTSYTTRFPEYIAARWSVPESWSYAALRRFHAAAALTMVSTPSLASALADRGFGNLAMWGRGVDTEAFTPANPAVLDLARPIFLYAGRIAIEKNIDTFLALDLPGSKVVVGEGPQEAELRARFPSAHFLGLKVGEDLASHIAAADVFVFPSLTDTFGIVQLEALACGVPVAAFPVTGPRDVIADRPVGALHIDLRQACLGALGMSRQTCRDVALTFSWENSARQFIENLRPLTAGARPSEPLPLPAMATAER
jgi:glycosyltransferase involved in cell wall biosynthesis